MGRPPYGSYSGEYYDEETGFIYLRARYYDPKIGRFISEDPIRDGLNWYAYCENNPIMFVDPSGLYYILQDKLTCSCNDPRCREFGRLAGTYTAYPNSWAVGTLKAATGSLPAGSVVHLLAEKMMGVVGGSSATEGREAAISLLQSSIEEFVQYLNKNGSCLSKVSAIAKKVAPVIVVRDALEEYNTEYVDNIIFGLFERNNVSTTSTSKTGLMSMMKTADKYVRENDWYFTKTYGNSKTLYEMHRIIAGSKDPQSSIKTYAAMFALNLGNDYIISSDNLCKYTEAYTSLLSMYDVMLDEVDRQFVSFARLKG